MEIVPLGSAVALPALNPLPAQFFQAFQCDLITQKKANRLHQLTDKALSWTSHQKDPNLSALFDRVWSASLFCHELDSLAHGNIMTQRETLARLSTLLLKQGHGSPGLNQLWENTDDTGKVIILNEIHRHALYSGKPVPIPSEEQQVVDNVIQGLRDSEAREKNQVLLKKLWDNANLASQYWGEDSLQVHSGKQGTLSSLLEALAAFEEDEPKIFLDNLSLEALLQ